jgi:16S rRNA (guanine966-N2)-methyltransferase
MNRPPTGQVRIIGGRLRGSKLPVPDAAGLRPTGDRVRETLFNWLQFELAGASVLDAFAGTGALGFEAASRGAAHVLLLERDPALAEGLRASARRLHAETVQVDTADALAWLRRPPTEAFDVAFLDPPFGSGLLVEAARLVAPWLAPAAWIYVEGPAAATPDVPADWREHRRGRTREVGFALYRRVPAGTLLLANGEDD